MEETTPLCLLVAITSIDTGGNLGREKLSRLRGVLSECFYTLQLWASVPSGGTTMDSGTVAGCSCCLQELFSSPGALEELPTVAQG